MREADLVAVLVDIHQTHFYKSGLCFSHIWIISGFCAAVFRYLSSFFRLSVPQRQSILFLFHKHHPEQSKQTLTSSFDQNDSIIAIILTAVFERIRQLGMHFWKTSSVSGQKWKTSGDKKHKTGVFKGPVFAFTPKQSQKNKTGLKIELFGNNLTKKKNNK